MIYLFQVGNHKPKEHDVTIHSAVMGDAITEVASQEMAKLHAKCMAKVIGDKVRFFPKNAEHKATVIQYPVNN